MCPETKISFMKVTTQQAPAARTNVRQMKHVDSKSSCKEQASLFEIRALSFERVVQLACRWIRCDRILCGTAHLA